MSSTPTPSSLPDECTSNGDVYKYQGLRIASVFIILIGSLAGASFPILARRSKYFEVPKPVFDFAKYFGSGVIIATGFIHLLAPAIDALTSQCLSPAWQTYPYAFGFCLLSIFFIFIVELIAFRWGTAKLAKLGLSHDPHGHGIDTGAHSAHGPEKAGSLEALEAAKHSHSVDPNAAVNSPIVQILGVAILEFGVILHSVLVGLTLAVNEDFKILFVVLIFHQTFEGLGVGSRLAYMQLPDKYRYVPLYAAILYGVTTPIGIAVGLGVKTSYIPGSPTASIVQGTLDSLSAGVLIYTGLVELLAHEFLFNKEMMTASNGKLAYALISMLAGCGIMALLGRWA